MIKHKRVAAVAALLMAAAVLATVLVYVMPSSVAALTGTSSPKYVAAMNKTEIMNMQIIADEAEWAYMLEHATEEEYIPATVIIDGIRLENVGIRPKGNSSLSMVARDSTTDRYSFKLEFDHYISGQTWLGLDKLVVNNMQSDASYMKEYLSYDIMAYVGVEAPIYQFADITVNGEAWGFYLAVEALEDSYAKRVYGNDHGKLYKPESMGIRGAGRMNEFIENMEGDNAEQGGGLQVSQHFVMQEPYGEQSADGQIGGEMLTDRQPAGEPPAGAMLTDRQPTGEPPAGAMLTDRQPTGEPPAGAMLTDMQPTGEPPAGAMLTDRQPTGEPPAGAMLTDRQPTGEPPAGEMLTESQPEGEPTAGNQSADMPAEQNTRNSTRNRGGFGGGMSESGVALQYTDNEVSSYSAIFENAVFKSTENDYRRVIQALEKLSNGEDLENVVDVEAVLKYFAAHTVVVNLDSYVSGMGHNYYLYEDGGKLTILPWDYNLSFGGFQSGNVSSIVNFPIDTPVSGVSLTDRPLLGKLLEVPEYLELYHGYLRQIVDGYFNSGLFEQTVDLLDTVISPYVEADPSAFFDYDAYQAAVPQLKTLGMLRAQSIEGQLNGTVPSTSDAQKSEPDKLIDAADVNLSALGSQGGGQRIQIRMPEGGTEGQGVIVIEGFLGDIDIEVMLQAMDIIQTAENGELSEAQLAQLHELGLTDEQIEEMKSMPQQGSGGRRPEGMGGMQNNTEPGGGFPQERQNPESGRQQMPAASGYDTNTLVLIGGCVALLLCGMWFVFAYKRRRA